MLKLFYSYSRKDEGLLSRLQNHLHAYEDDGLIAGWHDAKIPGGDDWKKEIEQRIGEADIVLLLMTENYQPSEWCMAEYDLAMARHDEGRCRVIPINLRAVEWCESLRQLNAIPPLSQPIVNGIPAEEDRAFQRTAQAIARVAELLPQTQAPPAPPPQKISQSLRLVQPPREITRDSAFLCNWTDPEDELKTVFLNLPAEKRRTPFLTLVCGHPDDCHENFILRIQHSPLKGLLGVKTVNPLRGFNWPENVPRGLTTDRLFTWRVAEALQIQADKPEKIVRGLAPGLTIIRSTIDSWSDVHETMIENYASFWDSWPGLPPGKALAPCLCIKGDLDQPRIEALRERIAFARFKRLRGAVVGLGPIQRSHALNWMIRPEIRPLYGPGCAGWLEGEIQAIFVNANQVRMQQVADGLTRALLNHAGEHTHAG